jgi:hypothetical protein
VVGGTWQSGTRIVISWLTVSTSRGGAKVTVGLSVVGPPPVTNKSQLPGKVKTQDLSDDELDTATLRAIHTLARLWDRPWPAFPVPPFHQTST